MGAFWSKKGNQFEKVLEKLDQNITYIEQRQKTATTNRKRLIAYLIYISVFSELIFVAWFYLFHKNHVTLLDKILAAYPLALPPLLGYIFSWLVTYLYTARIKSDEKKLIKLRADLKSKLEERKQATGFDTTQQLLSKYERLTKAEDSASSNKGQPQPQPQPVPIPQQAQQGQASQIRQRNSQPQPTTPSQPILPTPPAVRPPVVGQPVPSSPSNLPPRPPMPSGPVSKSWMDKLVDYVVGGEPQHSFALICGNCRAHNGLIPQSEMKGIEFRCRFCNYFNQAESATSSSSASTSPPSSSQKSPTLGVKDKKSN